MSLTATQTILIRSPTKQSTGPFVENYCSEISSPIQQFSCAQARSRRFLYIILPYLSGKITTSFFVSALEENLQTFLNTLRNIESIVEISARKNVCNLRAYTSISSEHTKKTTHTI